MIQIGCGRFNIRLARLLYDTGIYTDSYTSGKMGTSTSKIQKEVQALLKYKFITDGIQK